MSEKKNKKKKNNILLWIIVAALVCVIGFSAYIVVPWFIADRKSAKANNDVKNTVHESSLVDADHNFHFTHAAWNELYAINPDFKAYMAYDDEFVSEPIVQWKDNEFYLNHWIDTTWSDNGTFFFDCTNDLNDTNVTIYGHNVFYTLDKPKMTPMVELLDQSAYLQHPEFNIWYEDREARYLITNIFYWDAVQDVKFAFTQRNFDTEEEFNEYTSYVNAKNLIDPIDTLKYGDRFVSLQTCKDLYGSTRIVFICKEISSKPYE